MEDIVTYKTIKAKVISLEDPDQAGAIIIKPLPELEDVKDADCPRAYPWLSYNSTTDYANDMPEVGAIVRVLVDKYWQKYYYLGNKFFKNLFKFSDVQSQIGSIAESPDDTYKSLKFRKYRDGFLEFHNNDTGEHGSIHKNGSYNFYDATGNIFINGAGQKLKFYNDLNTLKEILVDIRDVVEGIITPTKLIDGESSPVTYLNVGVDLPKIKLVETKLDNLLED